MNEMQKIAYLAWLYT